MPEQVIPWSPEILDAMRELWVARPQISTSDIARMLGRRFIGTDFTKNAVLGKCRRLARQNPTYWPEREPPPPAKKTKKAKTLPAAEPLDPPLPPLPIPRSVFLDSAPPLHVPYQEAIGAPMPPSPDDAEVLRQIRCEARPRQCCQWPLDPSNPNDAAIMRRLGHQAPPRGSRTYHFCDGMAASGRPYCDMHVRVAFAYVRHA